MTKKQNKMILLCLKYYADEITDLFDSSSDYQSYSIKIKQSIQ